LPEKVKRLKKKFHSLEDNIKAISNELSINPRMGDSYGHNIYKIRVADESKGKGKSGGFRIITYLVQETKDGLDIYLVYIFDKSEESTITKKVIQQLIDKIEF